MTARMWSCLRSFTSLNHLAIADSSLSFPPSPHELPSVTELSAERVTSQSYEGLLSSLPGLIDIDITIDDAERDIAQITACLRRTGGQQLTHIKLTSPSRHSHQRRTEYRERRWEDWVFWSENKPRTCSGLGCMEWSAQTRKTWFTSSSAADMWRRCQRCGRFLFKSCIK